MEYLFGRDFHNLPIMVCTAGDNEIEMRQHGLFRSLAEAPLPKLGCVSVIVDSVDVVAADLGHFFGLRFVETDPGGLGCRALVGSHQVKLIEGPNAELASQFEPPLAAIEIRYAEVEAVRVRLESAGYSVKHRRPLKCGGKAYYFGATLQGMPLAIYPACADAEILGA